jgi:DNA-binding transcriptional regulator YiaG
MTSRQPLMTPDATAIRQRLGLSRREVTQLLDVSERTLETRQVA